MNSDQNFVGLPDGSVANARAMVRLVPNSRWSIQWVQNLVATPSNLKGRLNDEDRIEEEIEPHQMADAPSMEGQPDSNVRVPPRLKIMLQDLQRHGFTPNCPNVEPMKRVFMSELEA